jgi:hypothetical protein
MDKGMSLTEIMKQDPVLSNRIVDQVRKVKKSKQGLNEIATNYNQKYKRKVDEGTKKQQLLLEDGKRRGLSEEEVVKQHGFIPTIHTPILNFLYFLMYEYKDEDAERNNEISKLFGNSSYATKEHDMKVGRLLHEDVERENVPQMETFIYGNMTHEEFKRVKKLKALSRSDNEHEAFSAYKTCIKLCEKYGLDFDKVPIQ